MNGDLQHDIINFTGDADDAYRLIYDWKERLMSAKRPITSKVK